MNDITYSLEGIEGGYLVNKTFYTDEGKYKNSKYFFSNLVDYVEWLKGEF